MLETSLMDEIKAAIEESAPMSLAQIVTEEVRSFIHSPQYHDMINAERYYMNRSDIQQKTNEMDKRSNTKIEHPILRRLVEQKASFLLAKPFSISTENQIYADTLNAIFDRGLRRKLRRFVADAVKYGIAFLQPYVDQYGNMAFMRIPAREVIPIWDDAEHERLSGFIRIYEQTVYFGLQKKQITHAELWTKEGVRYFVSQGGIMSSHEFVVDTEHGEEATDYVVPHFFIGNTAYNWSEAPIIWLKYNDEEKSLCYYLKEMIDEVNWQDSIEADTLRDVSKFVYVLKNYGGTDLNEFVSDLRQSLAVKVDSDGGVDKLEPSLNMDAVNSFRDNLRRDLYDYAASVDTKDPNLGNASGTALLFRYMDLQNDCEALGNGLQESMERLKIFLDAYIAITGGGDFSSETFELIYNMDMPVNETDVINNIRTSDGIISKRTLLENHPWVSDVQEELDRIDEEQKENETAFMGFGTMPEEPEEVEDDAER